MEILANSRTRNTIAQTFLTSQASGSRAETLVTTDQTNLEAFITIVSVEPVTCAFSQIPEYISVTVQKKTNYGKHVCITTCIISTTNNVPVFINHCTSMATSRSYMCTLGVRLRPLQLLTYIKLLKPSTEKKNHPCIQSFKVQC